MGLGQLGTVTCDSPGGGLEHCGVGKLKTELSCLLGLSGTAVEVIMEIAQSSAAKGPHLWLHQKSVPGLLGWLWEQSSLSELRGCSVGEAPLCKLEELLNAQYPHHSLGAGHTYHPAKGKQRQEEPLGLMAS